MAVTPRFILLQSALVTSDAPRKALEAGILAVKAAYSNADGEMALALLNDVPQYMRKQFATWLRCYGVSVIDPARGTAAYTLAEGVVKDKSKQAKVFAAIGGAEVRPVLVEDIQVRAVKKVRPLEGTAASRAQKKMESTIKALKATDSEAAAYLNDTWATKSEVTTMEFEDGQTFDLSKAEMNQVLALIQSMRRTLLKAA
jgi:hypothetical protein